ncbi:hypothetical protein P691DRAFT_810315 [Macrolepiota fuliginosa MF-IS2]|uniref:Nephrocystin 3-like N-terminal domain-containing protein n=1 Tax=Macrolepiota fuliginosa MF-IS2 TaxID=1400762 RepID=A0A9P5X268_9AGAR|nr:hypothetical protein P691DRAFT_810315 [Macrolepiota fuliginosa MF-IS2]
MDEASLGLDINIDKAFLSATMSKNPTVNKPTSPDQSSHAQIKHKDTKRKTSVLSNAHDFILNKPTFVDIDQSSHTQVNANNDTPRGSGLRMLLERSTPGASHDSSDRYPPPRCHPGTRTEYIKTLTTWGHNANGHPERIAWMNGLAAVGKSAIAQTCAEALGDRLAAAFFFSRPNHRDKPERFFTSISHQLAVKYDSFGDIVDRSIIRNPTLVDKALPHQFRDLIVAPIQQLKREGEELPELVIVVDGLDECADVGAQEDIIEIVAKSAREGSTPFLWIFLSRPEPHLTSVFGSPKVKSITLPIELHVSREIDGDIAMFLTDKLRKTARRYPHLPSPWPSEEEIWVIVDLSDGLFACAEAVSRFIDNDMAGPEEQLRDALHLARQYSSQTRRDRPLTGLDGFYTLIMERVPPKWLQTVLRILLATRMPNIDNAVANANLLQLSESQFRNACRSLHSVMTINNNSPPVLYFYHASFLDFLGDPARSKQFWIWSDCAARLLDEVMLRFDKVQVTSDNYNYFPELPVIWKGRAPGACYHDLVCAFFKLLESVQLSDATLKALNHFDFRRASLASSSTFGGGGLWSKLLSQSGVIRLATIKNTFRSDQSGIWYMSFWTPVYLIGHGKKKALLVDDHSKPSIMPYSKLSIQRFMQQIDQESC